ncbi:DUF551 domain-containing protein [Claveliimonas bilis]|uniref:DUF551 domain-containing protein n=1 Tax=Claveliimonas bilis TaxID=3028070 RepID=UPI00292EE72E|nr:DUF551 domain-containing protein [Claveliimonas bilis]BDZ81397.1 hypothetical protein Lac3_26060 [Claveliimonas bilis]
MQELEKILEEIKKMLDENKVIELNGDGTVNRCIIDVALAWDSIKAIIHNHINAGWIPVEERAPEDWAQVLVSMYDRVTWVTIGTYNPYRKTWKVDQYITDLGIDVKAWQPLPEPYHPERSIK